MSRQSRAEEARSAFFAFLRALDAGLLSEARLHLSEDVRASHGSAIFEGREAFLQMLERQLAASAGMRIQRYVTNDVLTLSDDEATLQLNLLVAIWRDGSTGASFAGGVYSVILKPCEDRWLVSLFQSADTWSSGAPGELWTAVKPL